MMKKFNFFVLGFVFCLIIGGVAFGISQVTDVYLSEFPIKVNNTDYTPEMPILNYQGRTYLPLREFANVTGINVDFLDNTVLLDNKAMTDTKYFLKNTYMLLDTLSQIDKNNDLLLGYYIDFLSNSDRYASSNISTTTKLNDTLILSLNNNIILIGFETFGKAIGLDAENSISDISTDIQTYLCNTTIFNQTILDAMYFKTTSSEVSAQWDKLIDDFSAIRYLLMHTIKRT